ncbi:hypothetical protein ACOBQJ_06665 [Pelotomaculum propionicicum]|uniref:hypothetical protein n=1 Tax=Pelotomaculum propionicicum TaxID=258475 RepID=UPI003B7B0451
MALSRKAFAGELNDEEAGRLHEIKEHIAVAVMSREAADIYHAVQVGILRIHLTPGG